MGDDERALLAGIIADPEADAPRLVYADYLEEHGHPERAEFIRVQVELARAVVPAEPGGRYAELTNRERDLSWAYSRGWEADFARGVPAGSRTYFRFVRGMVGAVACPPEYFRDHGGRVAAAAPLEAVHLRGLTEAGLAAAAAAPAFARVSRLVLDADEAAPPVVRRLLDAPVGHLRSLTIAGGASFTYLGKEWAGRTAAVVGALAGCRELAGLRRLDLRHAGIGCDGARALAGSDVLRGLEVLLLAGNTLTEGVRGALLARFGPAVYFDYPDYRGRLAAGDLRW